ncbi:unnamed protein product [Cochlearia groenlandica]
MSNSTTSSSLSSLCFFGSSGVLRTNMTTQTDLRPYLALDQSARYSPRVASGSRVPLDDLARQSPPLETLARYPTRDRVDSSRREETSTPVPTQTSPKSKRPMKIKVITSSTSELATRLREIHICSQPCDMLELVVPRPDQRPWDCPHG